MHKVSNYIVKNQDIIIAEDLNIKNMLQNHKLAKSISNQGWYELTRQLTYKSGWNNKIFYQINRWYPSSQICNHCGYQNKQLKLSDRIWICPNCGKEIDRDYNASCNTRDLGLSDLSIVGVTKSYASGRIKVTDFLKRESVSSNEGRSPSL